MEHLIFVYKKNNIILLFLLNISGEIQLFTKKSLLIQNQVFLFLP